MFHLPDPLELLSLFLSFLALAASLKVEFPRPAA